MARILTIWFFALTGLAVNAQAADQAAPAAQAAPTLMTPPVQPETPATAAAPNLIKPPLKSITEISNDKLPEPKTQAVLPPPEFNKTLMYNNERLAAYKELYDNYQEKLKNRSSKGAVEDKVGELANKLTGDEKLKPAPASIFLNSILYRDDHDGVAWINGVKYKVNGVSDDVKLTALSQNHATIMWRTGNFDMDFKAWSDMFPSSSDSSPDLSKLPPSRQNIRVDQGTKSVIVTLRPNQSLDVANMAVKEGRIADAAPLGKDAAKAAPGAKTAPSEIDKLIQRAKEAVQDETPKPKAEEKPVVTAPVDPNAEKTATFHLSVDGHFNIPAKLNERAITFKADTGATITAISSDDAVKIGIDVTKLDYKYDVKIADGTMVKAAEANIENFAIEPIVLHNINILVTQGPMPQPLLGMSFFGKLKKFTIESDTLTLYQ